MQIKWQFIFLIASLVITGPSHRNYVGAATAAKWHLVWQDNFAKPGHPDPAKWSDERGFVRNKEPQYYQPGNAVVRGGMLVIEARKQRVANRQYRRGAKNWRYARKWAQYTSASLTTLGKESWLYGRFEMRAKLPAGAGMWPAFWLLGTDISKVGWPECGEIDVMEWLGREPRVIHTTVHWEGGHHTHQSQARLFTLHSSAAKKFHTYCMDWSPKHITFYIDGAKYFTFNVSAAGTGADNPFRKRMYLILNLAMGGNWAGPINNKALPAKYEIRYIRVYQRQAAQASGQHSPHPPAQKSPDRHVGKASARR